MLVCADIAWLLLTWKGPLNLSAVDWKNVPHYFWTQMKTTQVLTAYLNIWTTQLKPSWIFAWLPSVLNTVSEVTQVRSELSFSEGGAVSQESCLFPKLHQHCAPDSLSPRGVAGAGLMCNGCGCSRCCGAAGRSGAANGPSTNPAPGTLRSSARAGT